MFQIVEMSQEEREKMYSKLSKKELISMLIECNKHLYSRTIIYKIEEACSMYIAGTGTSGRCVNCEKSRWEHNDRV
jgi:hypothetical protein